MCHFGSRPSQENHLVYSQLHRLTTLQFSTIDLYRNGVGAGPFGGKTVQIKDCFRREWMICSRTGEDRAWTYTRKLRDPLEFDSLFRVYGTHNNSGKWFEIVTIPVIFLC